MRLDLAPENLAGFLPPFKLSGDVLSAELQDLSARVDATVVMGNSRYRFDDFSEVFGRWFTVGTPASPRANLRTWIAWTHGEAPRATLLVQTTARINRADVAPGPKTPPGRYALHIDYQADAAVYTGRTRYLPGNAYSLGLWVKGDGTKLLALFLDYTHAADFYEGGWKRIYDGDREIALLDFTDWRYFEVDLPGRGIGSNTPHGSTPNLDFPLELTAFHLETTPAGTAGSVEIGAIQVVTQQTQWNLFLPRTDGPLQNAVRVDWSGWRELKFRLPPVPATWNEPARAPGFLPNYPLGVHLAIDTNRAQAASGTLYVDDLPVTTNLLPEKRVDLSIERAESRTSMRPARRFTSPSRTTISPRRVASASPAGCSTGAALASRASIPRSNSRRRRGNPSSWRGISHRGFTK